MMEECACGIARQDCTYHCDPTTVRVPVAPPGRDEFDSLSQSRQIDWIAWYVYSLARLPGESDEELTDRCMVAAGVRK